MYPAVSEYLTATFDSYGAPYLAYNFRLRLEGLRVR
jgi:hypothetical protein